MILIDDLAYIVYYDEESTKFSLSLIHVLSIDVSLLTKDEVVYSYTGLVVGEEEPRTIRTDDHACFQTCEEALAYIMESLIESNNES